MDAATLAVLTAIGTFITGLAALLAVWFGYKSMRRQTKNAATTAWIQSFRTECANYLSVCDKLTPYSRINDSQKYYESATSLRLYLSVKKPAQLEMINTIGEFTQFLMVQNQADEYESKVTWSKTYPTYHRAIVERVESVISEAELTL